MELQAVHEMIIFHESLSCQSSKPFWQRESHYIQCIVQLIYCYDAFLIDIAMNFARELSRESVSQSLLAVSSPDPSIRKPAETILSQYETNIIPGYIGTLMEIASSADAAEVRCTTC
jgi:hypothetical protein